MWEHLLFSNRKTCQCYLYFLFFFHCMEPIQGIFFETAHSSVTASHWAAGKQKRQEENSAAVKIACRGKQLIKTKLFRKNEDQNTQWTTSSALLWMWELSPNVFFLPLFISDLGLLFKSCCGSPEGSIGWMFSLIVWVTFAHKYFRGGPKENIQFYPYMCWIWLK